MYMSCFYTSLAWRGGLKRSLSDALLAQCREAKNHGTAKLLLEQEEGDAGRQAAVEREMSIKSVIIVSEEVM